MSKRRTSTQHIEELAQVLVDEDKDLFLDGGVQYHRTLVAFGLKVYRYAMRTRRQKGKEVKGMFSTPEEIS